MSHFHRLVPALLLPAIAAVPAGAGVEDPPSRELLVRANEAIEIAVAATFRRPPLPS